MTAQLWLLLASGCVLFSALILRPANRLHIPSVIVLLIVGLGARYATHFANTTVQLSARLLAALGTAGLILIVLEGALDLQLDPARRSFVVRTFATAGISLVALMLLFSLAVGLLFQSTWLSAALVATPFAVVSSSVAIPGAESLNPQDREFVIYESSWSDILGVFAFNTLVTLGGGFFGGARVLAGLVGVVVVAIASGAIVYWLLGHVEQQVKFFPIIFGLILVYVLSDLMGMSPLLIVFALGLFLNNAPLFHQIRVIRRIHAEQYAPELVRLKHLVAEGAFVVRTFFFLLLGYTTDVRVLTDVRSWLFAAGIVSVILLVRAAVISYFEPHRLRPLVWIAPRGLITATLFFSVPAKMMPRGFPTDTLVLAIVLSGLVMAAGLALEHLISRKSPPCSDFP